ncbi:phosphoribosylglycinamide formyltransferase [Miniphocaeibacter massiliensis]|uniref:phosphoribosylglycinamide formyltransferase n=1 Tax=Miniphocaeibacter massiliensis TaxID=2041841 RepID=UPI000C1B860E|nr:phosphoribosylglycinamide formyltransferase [Miniphocaeibacter massiliensis]
MSLNIAVMVSGGGTNLQSIIDAVKSGVLKSKVKVVISNNKNAYGLIRAKKENIESIHISKKDFKNSAEYEKELLKILKDREIDLIVLAGYLGIIPESIVSEFKDKIINIHPSLIPSFCGKDFYGIKVHEKALERGVKITGATTHFVDSGIDTGKIIKQKAIEIKEGTTAKELQEQVLEVEHKILVESIKNIEQNKVNN